MNAMDKRNKDNQTPEGFGGMCVTWRLDEGLFSEEIGTVRYRTDDAEEKELSANELAREIGTIMMPFLTTHPDVGFESFRKTMRIMAKTGNVYCYHSPLAGEHPHIRISEAVDAACEAFGTQYPDEMMIYARLGSNQNLYINQYKNLKVHMFMHHRVKHVDIHIVPDAQSAGTPIVQGEIYVWLA